VVVVWYVFLTVLVLSGCCEYLFVMYYVCTIELLKIKSVRFKMLCDVHNFRIIIWKMLYFALPKKI